MLALGCALIACADESQRRGVDKPDAPRMRTLDAYDAPTAEISRDRLDDLLAQSAIFVAAVDQLGIERTLLQSLRAGLAQVGSSSGSARRIDSSGLAVQQHALSLPGNGYVEVRRICDGWNVAPVADPDNGELQLIAGFTESGIDPVVWGTVTACRYRLSGHQVQLDGLAADPAQGDVRLYVGENAAADELVTFPDPVVVELSAQATVDGQALATTELNFRIDLQTRALELLVPLGSGYALVRVDPARGGTLEARGVNGTFSCEPEALRCVAPDGEELRVR